MNKVLVAGVGMIPFTKPGASETYPVMGAKAAALALKDAGVDYAKVRHAYAGYVYGDSTAGQRALYGVGMTGIPIVNVNNNCSSGSTAIYLARQAIAAGVIDCALALGFDRPSTFESGDMRKVVGFDLSREAGKLVYEEAAIGPDDVDVCELHDCFAQNELITYEALGFCPEGGAEKFVEDGDNTYGGKVVTNPSGGLLSKGHPLGATGLAQCYELVSQLRGTAGERQVKGARLALQHNLGIGSACVVTLYGRA